MTQIRCEILSALADERFPPWFLLDDLIVILEKIGHIPSDIVTELNRLTEENLVHSSVSLLGGTLFKLASRPDSDETNSSS